MRIFALLPRKSRWPTGVLVLFLRDDGAKARDKTPKTYGRKTKSARKKTKVARKVTKICWRRCTTSRYWYKKMDIFEGVRRVALDFWALGRVRTKNNRVLLHTNGASKAFSQP